MWLNSYNVVKTITVGDDFGMVKPHHTIEQGWLPSFSCGLRWPPATWRLFASKKGRERRPARSLAVLEGWDIFS